VTLARPVLTVASLIAMPKTIEHLGPLRTKEPDHVRLDIELAAAAPGRFVVFVRVLRALSENFSIGLRYEEAGLCNTVLLRVNGDHGSHRNPDGSYFPEGPHVHTFRNPARELPPRSGAEAKWAWPLPPEHVSLIRAWKTFSSLVFLSEDTKVDKRIYSLYTSLAQLQFPQ
jgi:hypothetical protein